MPTKVLPRVLCWSFATLLPSLAPAQGTAQETAPQQPAKPPAATAAPATPTAPLATETSHALVRRYPQDRDVPVAIVADQPITLGDLVDHLDAVHHPGFRDALSQPHVQRMLQSDLIAPWVRQYADIKALEHFMKEREVDQEKLKAAQSEQLKKSFQGYLDAEVARRREAGRPTEFNQKQINVMLARYQLDNGLAAEMQGWLNYVEPGDYPRGPLQEFYQNNARAFGGTVTTAHILIQNRDPGTGILFDDAGLAKASTLLADVRARLRPDGSNFEEVARLLSADSKTAEKGGLLGNVHRFDDRLPAVLCRAAWELRDGEVSDVVESQYGWHIVKRLDFQQHMFILFTDDAIPSIQIVMHRARQEALLFGARAKAKVKLLL